AESGGQVGDTGGFRTDTGDDRVDDTRHAGQWLNAHLVTMESGVLFVGQDADMAIDSHRRAGTRDSLTRTHLLPSALRYFLPDHATQAGSLVEDGRLRFDFSNFSPVADEELAEIEWQANRKLISNAPVDTVVTSQDEAKKMGALAFFGDKYGEIVRVVKIGD